MQIPRIHRADGWHLATPDASGHGLRGSRARRFGGLALVVALAAGAGLHIVDDPRPLDARIGAAIGAAHGSLQAWQGQLSRGLQVSLRAVADGRDAPPPRKSAEARPAAAATEPEPPAPAATLATR